MDDTKYCEVCGSTYGIELHHIIFRSESKALINCKMNHVYLCPEHHRGTYGVHGKKGDKFNDELKLRFQNQLEIVFIKDSFEAEEIKEILGLNDRATRSLCKLMWAYGGKYLRDDIITACMGIRITPEILKKVHG